MQQFLTLLTGLPVGLVLFLTISQRPDTAEPPPVGICHPLAVDRTMRVYLEVDPQAVEAHLAHGDFLTHAQTGCQPTATPTVTQTPTISPTPTPTPSDNGDGYD